MKIGIDMKALKIDEKDNVATALFDIDPNSMVRIIGESNPDKIEIKVNSRIPMGHKIALTDIGKGEKVIKYGEVIGVATEYIKKGDWVHTHNLDSIRGKINGK